MPPICSQPVSDGSNSRLFGIGTPQSSKGTAIPDELRSSVRLVLAVGSLGWSAKRSSDITLNRLTCSHPDLVDSYLNQLLLHALNLFKSILKSRGNDTEHSSQRTVFMGGPTGSGCLLRESNEGGNQTC